MGPPNYRLNNIPEKNEESTASFITKILSSVVLGKDNSQIFERTFWSKPSCTSDCSCDSDCKHHCYCVSDVSDDCRRDKPGCNCEGHYDSEGLP